MKKLLLVGLYEMKTSFKTSQWRRWNLFYVINYFFANKLLAINLLFINKLINCVIVNKRWFDTDIREPQRLNHFWWPRQCISMKAAPDIYGFMTPEDDLVDCLTFCP